MALSTQIVRSSSSFPSSADNPFPSSYDVFISFCGVDTRNGFVDHLYAAFEQRGFIVFKDDKKLERGKLIHEKLSEAIKQSQYAVVVISENFAFSKWCLIELDKIVECETEKGLKILPIFYHIDPSEVRKQKEVFARAFAKHREDLDVGERQRTAWSAALRKVSNIAGWHVRPIISAEATIVKEITRSIFCGLQLNSSGIFNDLVGIKSRVKEVEKELCLEMDNVWSIGIYGMAGIGKTTLAKVIFETVRYEFDFSCFVHCGDENRICELQQQIVCAILGERNLEIRNRIDGIKLLKTIVRNKKVFIVLDDVKRDHLEQLVGSVDWFGEGSRIIVTSKDRQLLKPYVNKTYGVEPLGDEDALELFCQKAFKSPRPKPGYQKLLENIMRQVNGHPLAIKVIGSSLYDKREEVWIGVRDILKADFDGHILKKLEISYLMLGDSLKKYFLDIACFGDQFVNILKLFDQSSSLHIEALEDRSLINTRFGQVVMHGLLRKLGQRVVYQMSPLEPGNRNRLYDRQDIIHVLRNDSGTETIEGIVMKYPWCYSGKHQQMIDVNYESFSRMTRLNVLILYFDFSELKWNGDSSKLVLSNELRVLQWVGFPLKSLPGSFQSDVLVMLYLERSNIKVLWIGKKNFGQLKKISLCYSKYLVETPDFGGVPNLEELWLSGCERLRKIHPSIANLGKLVLLNLERCRRLRADVTSLLPLDSRNNGNGIRTSLLTSLKSLSSLRQLNLSGCSNLLGGPTDFDWFFKPDPLYSRELIGSHTHSWLTALTSITSLVLEDCNLSDGDIPNDISCLSLLRDLNLSKNEFTRIPEGIAQLSNLEQLHMDECRLLQSLSTSPPLCLSSLSYPLSNLGTPTTHKCDLLQSSSARLFSLSLSHCNLLDTAIPNHLGCLSWLDSLDLSGNKFTKLPENFFMLSNLRRLSLSYCSELRTLPKFPLSLIDLGVISCPLLEMDYYQMDVRNIPLRMSVWFSVATKAGYDGTPYKILQLYPRNLSKFCKDYEDTFMWGPTLRFEIPRWFNNTSTNLFQKIQCHVDVDSEYEKMGLALFVAYQVVHEQENSNCCISEDTNTTFLEFVLRFQASDTSKELPLVLRVPEVHFVGPNGFWAYIPALLFKQNGMELYNYHNLKTSIETSNLNVGKKEFGISLIHELNVSEFFDVLNSITPHGLELKNLKDFYFEVGV